MTNFAFKNIYKEKGKENPRGFALAHLRKKLIRPGAHGKCPKIIVIIGYI